MAVGIKILNKTLAESIQEYTLKNTLGQGRIYLTKARLVSIRKNLLLHFSTVNNKGEITSQNIQESIYKVLHLIMI